MSQASARPPGFWQDRILPYRCSSPDQKRFPVGWSMRHQTFGQIVDQLRPSIKKGLRTFRRIRTEFVDDLLQQGWLRLWEALDEDRFHLARMSHDQAVAFVTNRCGTSKLHSYLKRYTSYHALSNWSHPEGDVFEESITEIVIGSSLRSTERRQHALFAYTVDRLTDIQAAIHTVVRWCGDDIRKLAALYCVTTSVTQTDAGRIAGLPITDRVGRGPTCHPMRYLCKIVRTKLQEALDHYKPDEPDRHAWRRCLKAGDTQPVAELAHQYRDRPDRLLALYALTTRVARHTLVTELGVDDSALWYAMKRIRQELRQKYARRVRQIA